MKRGDLVLYKGAETILGLILRTEPLSVTLLRSDGVTVIGAEKSALEVVNETR